MYHFQRRPGVWQNLVQVALKWPNCIRKMLIPCGVVFPLLWTVVFWSQSPQDFNISVAAVTCKDRHMMASDAFFLQWALHRQDLFYPARNYALFLGQARWSSLWTWLRTNSLYFRSAWEVDGTRSKSKELWISLKSSVRIQPCSTVKYSDAKPGYINLDQ